MARKKKIEEPIESVDGSEEDAIIAAFTLIKEALENADWTLVEDAYESLSGERISVKVAEPVKKLSKLEKIKVALASKKTAILLPTDEDIEATTVVVKKKTKDGMTVFSTPLDQDEAKYNETVAKKSSSASLGPPERRGIDLAKMDTMNLPDTTPAIRIGTSNSPPRR